MNIKKSIVTPCVVALLATPLAQAADIKWNGFMSIAAGKTLDTGATYQADAVTTGTYTDEILFTPESMMALQASSTITDKLRATVQVVAHGANQFDPSVEWAFLSYDISENFTVNAGRIRLPLYFYSDYLDVGYSYHWVRPPMDVYAIPQSGLEGVSLRYKGYIADTVEVNAETWYGASDLDLAPAAGTINVTPFKVRDDMGVNVVFSWEWLQFRLLYNQLDIITQDTRPEGSSVITAGQPFETTYKSAALMLDYNGFIFRSEATKLDNGFKTDAGYASLGYQIGNFLPHFTYSFKEEELSFVSFTPLDTTSMTAGVTWGFSPSAVLKLEYIKRTDEIPASAGFPGFGIPPSPGSSKDTPMFAVAIDVVF